MLYKNDFLLFKIRKMKEKKLFYLKLINLLKKIHFSEKRTPAIKNLFCLQKTFCLAKKMEA